MNDNNLIIGICYGDPETVAIKITKERYKKALNNKEEFDRLIEDIKHIIYSGYHFNDDIEGFPKPV